ncbi:hypothetical protein C8R45DRAFT_1147821 [Mycena sanguinolenta]|nr:hypothetical protein C8R45DRAFT_1147821 [Mycena sanguinolenta]
MSTTETAIVATPAAPTSKNSVAENDGPKVGLNVDVITTAARVASASRTEPPRSVYIACSPMEINKKAFGPFVDGVARVMGAVGMVAPPNLIFHWGVIVGDYVHELSYDENYFNTYENRLINVVHDELHRDKYRLYPVGTTRFNDAAITEEGVKVIDAPYMLPRYHVRKNNCHKFVIELLNLICDAGRKKVTTSFSWEASMAEDEEVELVPTLVYAVPEDATDEEVTETKARAKAEHAKRMAEVEAKREQEEQAKAAAEEEAEKQAAMQEILDTAQELMARSELEQQVPEPSNAGAQDEAEETMENNAAKGSEERSGCLEWGDAGS